MKIVEIEATKVVVPMKPDTTNSAQFGERPFQWEPIFILRMHTDEGIVGLGETPRNVPLASVEDGIKVLLDKDPLQIDLQEICLLGGPGLQQL